MAYKKRLLFVNEASFMCTGFSNIGASIISRLHKTGKYEIAELGTYAMATDPRISNIPWKFYAGMPEQGDQEGHKEYHKQYNQWGRGGVMLGQFGAWNFDKVVLDFKPDVVIGWMDFWMSTVAPDSSLRPLYKIIYMPCIDSTPLRQEWLNMLETQIDYITGYSDMSINVMKEQSLKLRSAGGRKIFPMPTRPGAELSIFKPMDKAALRSKWGINKDLPIFLTTMRNQARKLYCELLDSFAKFKRDNIDNPIAQKAVLLIHSSGYDAGQEYWLHIYRLSQCSWMKFYFKDFHKHVLHSYQCDSCGSKHIDYAVRLLNPTFVNGRPFLDCNRCGQKTLRTPNTNVGYTREELAEIYNISDVYVQASVAGADEMPITEAKACGIPVIATANAAMLEKVKIPLDYEGKPMLKKTDGTPYTMHLGGIPVDIEFEFTDSGTMQTRSYFSKSHLAKQMKVIFDKDRLKKLGEEALIAVKDNCDYDVIAQRWEYIVDNLVIKDRNTTWDKPIRPEDLPAFNITPPPELTNEEFVDWCYINVLKADVDKVGRLTWIENLQHNRPREEVLEYFKGVASKDKHADIMLWNYRQQKQREQFVSQIANNPNVLKGILCQ